MEDESYEPKVLLTIGGPIDEVDGTLGLYGRDLDPAAISAILGCAPTSSYRRGDLTRTGRLRPQGMWSLAIDGKPPRSVDEVARDLLDKVPSDPAVWRDLRARYRVVLSFTLFVVGQRDCALAAETLVRITALGVDVRFAIYPESDDDSLGAE